MIRPLLKDDALLTDILTADEGADHFIVWWLGQSGFLLKWDGQFLLFDPYLSDSITKKYADSNKPHVRMTELVVDPAKLDFINVATSSHNHTDHLDPETLSALSRVNPKLKLVLPSANIEFAKERLAPASPELIGLDAGTTHTVGQFRFTGIPAAHAEIDRDNEGRCHYLGFVVEFGPWCVYHSGDTLWHPGLVPALVPLKPDLMLLPINGNAPDRRVAGNLNGAEAATLARACSADMVIPCHYDMFEFNTASPEEFVTTCERIRQPHRVLLSGECWTSRSING